MSEDIYPYVLFLPTNRKQKVLKAVFGSKGPIDILQFSIDQGITNKIYQQDLIERLNYSNKTVIDRLKDLVTLKLLEEGMEKKEGVPRSVWVKYYTLTDLGRWFALLLAKEDTFSREETIQIVKNALRIYVNWLHKLTETLQVDKKIIEDIFTDEMK
jgi:hypothetical protein